MGILTIVILAITVEALIEYAKLIFVNKTIVWKQIGALVLGVLLAVAAGVDLFQIVGVTFGIPYLGMILTGIIFSRGANYVSDFFKLISTAGQNKYITMTGLGEAVETIKDVNTDVQQAETLQKTVPTDGKDEPNQS